MSNWRAVEKYFRSSVSCSTCNSCHSCRNWHKYSVGIHALIRVFILLSSSTRCQLTRPPPATYCPPLWPIRKHLRGLLLEILCVVRDRPLIHHCFSSAHPTNELLMYWQWSDDFSLASHSLPPPARSPMPCALSRPGSCDMPLSRWVRLYFWVRFAFSSWS